VIVTEVTKYYLVYNKSVNRLSVKYNYDHWTT